MTRSPIPVIRDAEACRWLSGLFARELDDSAIAAYVDGAADPMLGFLAQERGLVSEVGRVCEAVAGWTAVPDKRLVLAADFAALFLVDGNWGAPPYASVYLDPGGRMLQAPHERMVRRLHRVGLEVRRDLKEPADHLSSKPTRRWCSERDRTRGYRLDIPAGTAVRFEPGQTREVVLVPYRGRRVVHGFNGRVAGRLED